MLSSAWGHTNAVSVFLDTSVVNGWEVIVDDVHDVADVNATGTNSSGHKNGCIARPKSSHGSLTLLLSSITVDGSNRKLQVVQEVVKIVGFHAAVDEDDSSHAVHLFEETDQNITLLVTLSLQNDLLDVGCGTSGPTNTETNVRSGEVVLGEITSSLGESCGKQTILDIALILI